MAESLTAFAWRESPTESQASAFHSCRFREHGLPRGHPNGNTMRSHRPCGETMTTATLADLNAALPHVLAAPKTDAPISTLCLRPGFGERVFPGRITMTRAEGIPGERWATLPWLKLADGAPDPRIQVSILPSRVMDLVWLDRSQPHPGDPIVADLEMTEANLPVGTLIRAGTAVLRVSNVPNNGCVKWKARYGADAMSWITADLSLRLRGVLCSVEVDGEVALADRLQVLR